MIGSGDWFDWKNGSGNSSHPGKKFFLNLAALVVRDFESARNEDDVPLVWKAIIGSGMVLNLNGQLEVRQ